jgi:hypothetical protein
MLDKYSIENQRTAVAFFRAEILEGRQRPYYVPSLDEIERYLIKATRKTSDTTDYVRNYWRTSITSMIERDGAVVFQLWPFGTPLAKIPEAIRGDIVRRAQALLDELCAMEAEAGKRTPDMHNKLMRDVLGLLTQFRPFALANNAPRETKKESSTCSS